MRNKTYTQQRADEAVIVVQLICEDYHMKLESWNELLFDIGYEFAELVDSIDDAMDKSSGYWSWWMDRWIDDDKVLWSSVTASKVGKSYEYYKRQMLVSGVLRENYVKSFSRFYKYAKK